MNFLDTKSLLLHLLCCLLLLLNIDALANETVATVKQNNDRQDILGPYQWAKKGQIPKKFGPVLEGQSLWRVARRINKAMGVSVAEMSAALYQANPHAFQGGDIAKLLPDSILNIPAINIQEKADTQLVRPVRKVKKIENGEKTGSKSQPQAKRTASQEQVKLTLRDAITIALKNNRTLKTNYLNRISQKLALDVAKSEFNIKPTVTIAANNTVSGQNVERGDSDSFAVTNEVTLKTVTGGQLRLSLGNTQNNPIDNAREYSSAYVLSFTQPLLKGGGIKVGRSPLTLAEIAEEVNILNLKAEVISVISSVIQAYRNLLQAEQQYLISQRAVERAIKLEENVRVQIKAGIFPRQEIVQAQLQLSQQQLSVLSQKNAVNNARLALLNILDIDSETKIVASDEVIIDEFIDIDFDEVFKIALSTQPAYLNTLLSAKTTEISFAVEKNNQLWSLDAQVSATINDQNSQGFNDSFSPSPDYFAGLTLTIPLNDKPKKKALIDSKIALEQSKINIQEAKETLYIQTKQQIDTIESVSQQLKIAQQSRDLAQKQLEVENIKLGQGLSSNFQITEFEDQLIESENSLLSAKISYLDALTSLDQFLGTTLQTWKIPFQTQRQGLLEVIE